MNADLDRFKTAQYHCYKQVVKELKNGKKESHWMWFIFPQISGLGKSATAKKYEIKNVKEAYDYLADPLLATRLLELVGLLAYQITGRSAKEIFGFPDDLKFHSSITLFYLVVENNSSLKNNTDFACFKDALIKYYNGEPDQRTVENF